MTTSSSMSVKAWRAVLGMACMGDESHATWKKQSAVFAFAHSSYDDDARVIGS
jgi:hypothetical protein